MLQLVRDGVEVEPCHHILGPPVAVHRSLGVGHEQIEHLLLIGGGAGGQAVARRAGIQIPREEEAADREVGVGRRELIHRPGVEQDDAAVLRDVGRRPEGGGVHGEDQRIEGGRNGGELRVGVAPRGVFLVAYHQRARAHGCDPPGAGIGIAARLTRVGVQPDLIPHPDRGGGRLGARFLVPLLRNAGEWRQLLLFAQP